MPVKFITTQWTIKKLIEWRKSGRLLIPKHQRGFVWDCKRKIGLIDTIQRNLPIPSITFSGSDMSGNKFYIEDGQQRIQTFILFTEDNFDIEGIFFSALGNEGQQCFLNYKIPVLIYTGATPEERIEIFDRLQNGLVLSNGERFHAMRFLSPLVQHTCEVLLYEDAKLQKYCEPIWGLKTLVDRSEINTQTEPSNNKKKNKEKFGDSTRRFRVLNEAICIVSGTLWGPNYYTDSYEKLREKMRLPLTEIQIKRSIDILKSIIHIYSKAIEYKLEKNDEKLSLKKLRDSFWNPKNFTGFIVASLWEFPNDWNAIQNHWITFLIKYRKDPTLLRTKLINISSGIKELETKYKSGYNSITNTYTSDTFQNADENDSDSTVD